MISRIRLFLTALLTLLIAAILALAPVSAKPASGEYQLFGEVAAGHQAVISLAALENFDYHAKIAPECCNAPKGGVATLPKAPPPPTGKFNTIYPRGPGAADGPLPEGYTYVSRWVSPQEAKMWLDNQGTAIPSAAGHVPGATTPRVFVTQQFDGTPPGATGSIRIDFAAPEAMMHTGTGSSTGLDRVIFQPATSTPIHNVRIHVPDGGTIPK